MLKKKAIYLLKSIEYTEKMEYIKKKVQYLGEKFNIFKFLFSTCLLTIFCSLYNKLFIALKKYRNMFYIK